MNLIGQRIGSYIVERELGAGGTGTVYACRHTMIDREVAVKVLHDEQARDPDQVARFFQEAKAAAEIGHPNIIVIIDYGSIELPAGARTYVMMESLQGQSLDKRLRRGGLSLDDIRHILAQVASALVACHGKGIIHRDLKPSNIYLCERSFDPMFVKVLDFGTAKLAAPTPGLRKTQIGVVIGTPAYMSPEQCEGKGAIDHRSDVYSLGAMLYEMLTGALPHDGEIGDILLGHLYRTPVPPRERNPSLPAEWEALCLRMMEKSREARFQSITQLAHALEDLRGHAAAYEEARARRAASGHSGHTLVSRAPDAPASQPTSDARATLRVDVGEPHAVTPAPQPYTTGAHQPTPTPQPYTTGAHQPTSTPQPYTTGAHQPTPQPYTTGAHQPTPQPYSTGAHQPTPQPYTTGAHQPTPQPYATGAHQPTAAPAPQPYGTTSHPAAPTILPFSTGSHVAPGGVAATVPPTGAHRIEPHHTQPHHTQPHQPHQPHQTQPHATGTFDFRGACTALVDDPRHAAFSRTLMLRPAGLWFELSEICNTAHVAPPASLASDLGMFVTWVEHPYPDPSLAAVVFLSLRSGWSTVVLCQRVR